MHGLWWWFYNDSLLIWLTRSPGFFIKFISVGFLFLDFIFDFFFWSRHTGISIGRIGSIGTRLSGVHSFLVLLLFNVRVIKISVRKTISTIFLPFSHTYFTLAFLFLLFSQTFFFFGLLFGLILHCCLTNHFFSSLLSFSVLFHCFLFSFFLSFDNSVVFKL